MRSSSVVLISSESWLTVICWHRRWTSASLPPRRGIARLAPPRSSIRIKRQSRHAHSVSDVRAMRPAVDCHDTCRQILRIFARLQRAHARVESSHARVESSHARVESSHARVESSHARVESSHARAESSHARAESSHARVESSHARVESVHAWIHRRNAGRSPVHSGAQPFSDLRRYTAHVHDRCHGHHPDHACRNPSGGGREACCELPQARPAVCCGPPAAHADAV
jgi:hypothetical protein